MKKSVSLLLVLLLAVSCMFSLTGCNRTDPHHRFEDAAADLMEYFEDFADTNDFLPDLDKHDGANGVFTVSMGADSAENNFGGKFQVSRKTGTSRLDMNLPLALIGVDGTSKMNITAVQQQDGSMLIFFPDATDYVLQQAGSTAMPSDDALEDAKEDLLSALNKAASADTVSWKKVKITVAGKADTETVRYTMTTEDDKAAELFSVLAESAAVVGLTDLIDSIKTLVDTPETLKVAFYVHDDDTVRTEITIVGSNDTTVRMTLSTESGKNSAEWIFSLAILDDKTENAVFTATGDRKNIGNGIECSFETLTLSEDGSSAVTRINCAVVMNEESQITADTSIYTSATVEGKNIESEIPFHLEGVLTDEFFRGKLTSTLADAAMTAELDVTFQDDVKVEWKTPQKDKIVDADAGEASDKYTAMVNDLYERYPELMNNMGGNGEDGQPKPSLTGNFMLVNSDSSEMYIFHDNNTGVRRMILSYTETNNTVTAKDVNNQTITFAYDPAKTSQTIRINGFDYTYSVVEGDIVLHSEKAWADIMLTGEGMMLVDQYFNYMISGETLTTFSGRDEAPVDHTFTKDGSFYYINQSPFSYAAMD